MIVLPGVELRVGHGALHPALMLVTINVPMDAIHLALVGVKMDVKEVVHHRVEQSVDSSAA